MEFRKQLTDYATRELEIIGFMESPLGQTCLDFLEKSAEVSGNNPETMKQICGMLSKLIEFKPVAPITEQDFEPEFHPHGEGFLELKRCTRYFYLYQMPDGKYYDDRYQAFLVKVGDQDHKIYLYTQQNNSKQEVQLPYFPNERLIALES